MFGFIKKGCAGLVLVFMIVACFIVAVVADASAEAGGAHTKPCVTKAEYRAVQDGWRMKRVHRVFDQRGRLVALIPESGTVRGYNTCWSKRSVYVYYDWKPATGVWRVYDKERPRG